MDRQDWKDLAHAVGSDVWDALLWVVPIAVFVVAIVVLVKG